VEIKSLYCDAVYMHVCGVFYLPIRVLIMVIWVGAAWWLRCVDCNDWQWRRNRGFRRFNEPGPRAHGAPISGATEKF